MFRVVKVSGTMRKAEEEAIRRARKEIARASSWVGDGSDGGVGGEDAVDTGDVMDITDEED